jgi:hypothetical protein
MQKHEVQELLAHIEKFIVKGPLSQEEFEAGEDDMAFVTSFESAEISIANDVISLPPYASVKQRLAVSFAIAQSAVLSIFENRVEQKIEEYKYIPETLAKSGRYVTVIYIYIHTHTYSYSYKIHQANTEINYLPGVCLYTHTYSCILIYTFPLYPLHPLPTYLCIGWI